MASSSSQAACAVHTFSGSFSFSCPCSTHTASCSCSSKTASCSCSLKTASCSCSLKTACLHSYLLETPPLVDWLWQSSGRSLPLVTSYIPGPAYRPLGALELDSVNILVDWEVWAPGVGEGHGLLTDLALHAQPAVAVNSLPTCSTRVQQVRMSK